MNVQLVIFLSLLLDLIAFTVPLPLFPRLIDWYLQREGGDPRGLLSRTLGLVGVIRSQVLRIPAQNTNKKWDVVLLGGLMGSLFSTLQFIISPQIGGLSDRFGRKNVLLVTMIGNILSAVVWLFSTTFASFMLSRAIGGISEGNVQLAIAILSDVTTPSNRSRALAMVGIAFSICFTFGPPLGAYFASHPFTPSFQSMELNIYATPAALTLILLIAETLFLAIALPETRGKGFASRDSSGTKAERPTGSVQERISILQRLRTFHFLFLTLFSGVEFTLTFLSFDLFDWDNTQNGKLLGAIGVLSALLQGGYVRRSMHKVGEGVMARNGVASCAISLALLTAIPHAISLRPDAATYLFWASAIFLAFTSATVVTSLTAFASLQCDEVSEGKDGKAAVEHPELAKGRALGQFRSSGQLGRAIGPLLACASYWTFGPSPTYAVSAIAMVLLVVQMKSVAIKPKRKD